MSFKKNYKNLGAPAITYFEAVDGKRIDRGTWQYNMGALGCRLSHLTIFNEALAKGYRRILILEDDAVIRRSFRKDLTRLHNYTNGDWDMIYFGGNHYLKPQKINQYIIKLQNTLTTHAIAYNCRCLKQVIDKVERDERWVDSVIADLHLQLKVFGFANPPALQLKGYSDIEEKITANNPSLFNKGINRLKRIFKK